MPGFSPLPSGLSMTRGPMTGSAEPISPAGMFMDASDSDLDREDGLSFSSHHSRERRNSRRRSFEPSAIAPNGNTPAHNQPLSNRSRSGSSASARKGRSMACLASADEHARAAISAHHATGLERSTAASTPSPSMTNTATTTTNGTGSRPSTSHASREAIRPEVAQDGEEHRDVPLARAGSPTPSELEQLTKAVAGLSDSAEPFLQPQHADDENGDEFPLLLRILLHPLRLLAVVPGCLGTFWLARNAMLLAWQDGRVFSEVRGLASTGPMARAAALAGRPLLGVDPSQRQPGALDFFVACLWSLSTAYHALSFTTLLLRRWLLYYSILPSIIRLLALQAICWPLVRMTVFVFGVNQPLGAWVVIGTTTALSDIISRWVTSNIADARLEGEEDSEDEDDYAYEYLDEFGQIRRPNPGSRWTEAVHGQRRFAVHTGDVRSGDESDGTVMMLPEGRRKSRRRKGGQGTRFWRAVIGGPSRTRPRRSGRGMNGARGYLSGNETELEGESDWAGYGTDQRSDSSYKTFTGLRRRNVGGALSSEEDEGDETDGREAAGFAGFSGRRPRTILMDTRRARVSSRREFRWDVAMRRNVLPIAALGYLSMWVLILDGMRIGAGGGQSG